jgi:hypothetical protein
VKGTQLDFEITLDQQLFELGTFTLKVFEPGNVGNLQFTVFAAPRGEGRFRDSMLAA